MIRIVTDSTADIPSKMAEENGISIVPLKVCINDKEYFDGVTIGKDEFYHKLVDEGVFPKTSQPTPNDFLDIFNDIKAKGDECICITLSSSLSGTYQSALLAKKLCEYDNIHIIDSLSATGGMLLLVHETIRLIKDGKSAEEIVETIEALKNRIHIVAALSTLEYLKKGGRISAATAAIGSLARIKPIITVDVEGNVDVFTKAIGFNKAISTVIENMTDVDTNYPIYPVYTYGTENLTKLLAHPALSKYSFAENVQVGPTIGTHVGPEVFGFCYIGNNR